MTPAEKIAAELRELLHRLDAVLGTGAPVPSLADAPRFAVAELDGPDGHWEWVCLPSYDGHPAPWLMVFGENCGAWYGPIKLEELGAVVTHVPQAVAS